MMNSLTYLALGDSYTIGELVKPQDAFPNQTVQIFNSNSENIKIQEPKIIATTGWTTDELSQNIKSQNLNESFDLVTLLVGVNNQYRGRIVDNFKDEFEYLLTTAINFADNKKKNVLVISIPDWGLTPFGIAKNVDSEKVSLEIDQYNQVKKNICDKYDIAFLDITQSTREHAKDSKYLAEDMLHYSEAEYRIWAEQVAAYWKKIKG